MDSTSKPSNEPGLALSQAASADAAPVFPCASNKFRCPYPACPQTFWQYIEVHFHHSQFHLAQRLVNCPEPGCSITFATSKPLQTHWDVAHNPYFLVYKCIVPGCGHSCPSHDNIINHLIHDHEIDLPVNNPMHTTVIARRLVNCRLWFERHGFPAPDPKFFYLDKPGIAQRPDQDYKNRQLALDYQVQERQKQELDYQVQQRQHAELAKGKARHQAAFHQGANYTMLAPMPPGEVSNANNQVAKLLPGWQSQPATASPMVSGRSPLPMEGANHRQQFENIQNNNRIPSSLDYIHEFLSSWPASQQHLQGQYIPPIQQSTTTDPTMSRDRALPTINKVFPEIYGGDSNNEHRPSERAQVVAPVGNAPQPTNSQTGMPHEYREPTHEYLPYPHAASAQRFPDDRFRGLQPLTGFTMHSTLPLALPSASTRKNKMRLTNFPTEPEDTLVPMPNGNYERALHHTQTGRSATRLDELADAAASRAPLSSFGQRAVTSLPPHRDSTTSQKKAEMIDLTMESPQDEAADVPASSHMNVEMVDRTVDSPQGETTAPFALSCDQLSSAPSGSRGPHLVQAQTASYGPNNGALALTLEEYQTVMAWRWARTHATDDDSGQTSRRQSGRGNAVRTPGISPGSESMTSTSTGSHRTATPTSSGRRHRGRPPKNSDGPPTPYMVQKYGKEKASEMRRENARLGAAKAAEEAARVTEVPQHPESTQLAQPAQHQETMQDLSQPEAASQPSEEEKLWIEQATKLSVDWRQHPNETIWEGLVNDDFEPSRDNPDAVALRCACRRWQVENESCSQARRAGGYLRICLNKWLDNFPERVFVPVMDWLLACLDPELEEKLFTPSRDERANVKKDGKAICVRGILASVRRG